MRKRKFAILSCLLLTIAVAPFGSTEVMAYEGSLAVPDDTCTMETLDGTSQPITVQVQRPNNQTWRYDFSGIGSGANQILMLLPVCVPELNYGGDPAPQLLSPGLGDPTTGFGYGDFQNYSFRVAAILNGSQGMFTVTTGLDTGKRATSLQLKAGKSLYYCKNISGPSCTDGSLASRLHSTCENILTGFDEATGLTTALEDPFSIKTVINESSCELTVSVWDGLDCTGSSTNVPAGNLALQLDGGAGLFSALECGSSNQRCGICELIGHRNPCSITKYAAGRPYTYCYNCTTGAQVSCQ
jgi:hypothetical protein